MVSRLLAEDQHRLLPSASPAIGAVRDQHAIRVCHRQDTSADGDRAADQARGIPRAIHALVVRENDARLVLELPQPYQDVDAHLWVLLHDHPLLVCQWTWLDEDLVGDLKLAEVMQQACTRKRAQRR